VDEIATTTGGWLNDMETIRFKSKKMNGAFSGALKDRIACTKVVINALVERIKETGDLKYLRRRNDELASQLRESCKEESSLKNCLKEAKEKIKDLGDELSGLRAGVGAKSLSVVYDRPDRVRAGPSSQSGVALRVPIPSSDGLRQSTPRGDKNARGKGKQTPSVLESLQDCDVQLKAMAMCDEKISRFEELLTQMRSDLYGSIEALSDS